MKSQSRLPHLFLPMIMAALLLGGLYSRSVADTADTKGVVIQLTIEEAIGPATVDYIERALVTASHEGASLVVIRMDTPGGLDSAMRSIIKNITNSSVPVASYVAPSGARAASAGTYILYASHIAAMAPGTNLGAATPVQMSPAGLGEREKGTGKDEKSDGETTQDSMKQKLVNDAVAYIRGLAQLHGRNQEWAESAVREAVSIPAEEALKLNVIDMVAVGMTDLLQQIDGREVKILGAQRTLHTTGVPIRPIDQDWRSRLLSVITSPNVAYILMLIGIYGLIFEFSNPGSIVPGTVGAIALILALYAFQLLPINYAGMGLILLGVALMVGEAFAPSFGMLGIGGVISFAIGSVILMDTDVPGFGIDISVIVVSTVISAMVFVLVIGMAFRARQRPVVSGQEELLGGVAVVLADFERRGRVHIHGETWTAVSDTPLREGQQVKVTGIDGLVLQVKPMEPPN